MRTLKRIGMTLFAVLVLAVTTFAQEDCLPIIEQALDATNNACQNTGRNEICYGNNLIFSQMRQGVTETFSAQGDIVPVDILAGITLSPLDVATNLWGVSLLNLQANLPDTTPGQNVLIIVFGNVEVGELTGSAFRFQSGVGNAQCSQAPDSGIMVRTPEGVAEITLTLNQVNITLGSTAFLEADETEGMNVTLLDGRATVEVAGIEQEVSFSQTTNIPMTLQDGVLVPSGPPSVPTVWDAEQIARLFIVYNSLNLYETGGTESVGDGGIIAPPVNTEPCMIFAEQAFTAGLRVGPGTNRTRRAWLEPNVAVDVTGTTTAEGRVWWQLDKFQAFPQGANSVLELWVAEDQVTEQGGCDQVVDADAPPIIQPPTGPPDPVTTEEPIDNGNYIPPIVTFMAEDDMILYGTCTNLLATVEYISSAFVSGPGMIDDVTVEGPVWSTVVCPPFTFGTYTYVMDVFDLRGELFQYFVTIEVQ